MQTDLTSRLVLRARALCGPRLFLLTLLLSLAALASAQTNDVWKGGIVCNGCQADVGKWSNGAYWTNGVPNGNFNVYIDNGNPFTSLAILDINADVVALTVDPDDTLKILSATVLRVTGPPGSFTNLSGGTLQGGSLDVLGTLQYNGGDITTLAASLTLDGPGALITADGTTNALKNLTSITGGLNLTDGSSLTTNGPLSLSGGLGVSNGSNLTIRGPLNVTGAIGAPPGTTSTLFFRGGTLSTQGDLTNSGSVTMEPSSTLDVSGDFTNSGSVTSSSPFLGGGGSTLNVSGAFKNLGLLMTSCNSCGGSLAATAGSFSNTGTVQVGVAAFGAGGSLTVSNGNYTQTAGSTDLNGSLTLDHGIADFQGGEFTGNATVNGSVQMAGTFDLRNDRPSLFTTQVQINGNYTQLGSGVLNEYIGDYVNGNRDFSALQVGGNALLDGTVDFIFCFQPACQPATGESFAFLSYLNLLDGSSFSHVEFTNWTPRSWSLDYGSNGVTLVINENPTPEPGTLFLLTTGLGLILLRLHCRTAAEKAGHALDRG